MEGKEKLTRSSLPRLLIHITSDFQSNDRSSGEDTDERDILEEDQQSSYKGSLEDKKQKTSFENDQGSSVAAGNGLPIETIPEPSHLGEVPGLQEAHDANREDRKNMKPHDNSVLPGSYEEGDHIALPREAIPTPSHPGGGQQLDTASEAFEQCIGEEADLKMKGVSALLVVPQEDHMTTLGDVLGSPAEALSSGSQDYIHGLDGNHHQPDECDAEATEMGYDSFVEEILGCLDELKDSNSKEDQDKGDAEREVNESRCTPSAVTGVTESNQCCPEYTDYFEPALFKVLLNDVNNLDGSGSDELDFESCSEDVTQALNKSYLTLEMDNYDRHLPDVEKSFLESTEQLPSVCNNRICDIAGASQTRDIFSSSLLQKGFCLPSIKLPTPENLREHYWMVADPHAFNLGSSGFSYSGDISNGEMHGFGRLMLGEGRQFLEGVWNMNRFAELYSCNLICEPGNQTVLAIKRQNDYLLTMYENHYVARVVFDDLEELDFTVGIAHLKRSFFRKLRILEVVADELEQKKLMSLNIIATLLAKTISADSNPITRANTFILLRVYLEMPDPDLSDIFHESKIPVEVRDAAADLLECENRYLSNNYMFPGRAVKLRLDLRTVLGKIYNDGIVQHRQMLIDKCPCELPNLLSSIRSLPESKIVYVTSEDMQVFHHLVSQPCFEQYKNFFVELVERFCVTIQNIRARAAPSTVIPVMSPVYGFLFKSFWEIVSEIIAIADSYEYKDMLYLETGNWKILGKIRWPEDKTNSSVAQKVLKFLSSSEAKHSMNYKALDIQYNFIFRMLKYFSPGNYAVTRKYTYDFRVLEKDLSLWEKGLAMVRKKVGLAKRLNKMTTERVVWLCLLDHTIYEVFKNDSKYRILLKPYSSLFQGQISFIEKSPTENHETFRVMTHSILKFVISTAPYFREAGEKSGIDVEIVVQQMWALSTASREIREDPNTFSNFRDLIAEYNRYLDLRQFINTEVTSGHFAEQISQMMQTFMHIVATSMRKTVPTATLVEYLRSLNDFLDDFKNIDFLAIWFVKNRSFYVELLEKVDNKLTGENCSYRVIDVEKFVKVVQILGNQQPIPQHYIIQVVSQLLDCIEICLNKQWQSRDVDLQVTQLECTGWLLDAIRKSFMYLKEQPDYVDFETFEKDSVDPFVHLLNDCKLRSDMKERCAKISEAFWYIRKVDEIGIDRAMVMFKNANDCHVSSKLLDCYNLYLEKYNEHISEYGSLISGGRSHSDSMNGIVQMMNYTNHVHFSTWSEEFKTVEIPVLLACLSAVWSISVSKDVSSTGKFLKPHCIQILCILRLLSVDQSTGADNHLGQVLTGQGKSVILGLLSAVLALTGHKVKVLCYSKYLSERDQSDFDKFFQFFQLTGQVEYGTFKEMANKFLNPIVSGSQISLRQLVKDRVMNHETWPSVSLVTPASKNTVLLIDEVDVFFTDEFYGNSYLAGERLQFQGLADLQEYIWALVTSGTINSAEPIVQLSKNRLNDKVAAGDVAMVELNDFLNKPGTFPLLAVGEDDHLVVETYTNRSLFDEHLLLMVNSAVSVKNHSWDQAGYALTGGGFISTKGRDGIYETRIGYSVIFNYFRLKGSNFDSKSLTNYGYLCLKVGKVSYDRLPLQFKLILGVSGTLTNLGEYERSGIKSYNIHNFSVLPSFFGTSNLEFNAEADCHYYNLERDWLMAIYDRANAIVDSHRAILIFFESDVVMNEFSKEYKSKFDRFNELTENTDAAVRDACINGAGLSCTVTLATRGMGRGVDYKSSLSVEKKGGVHVLQSFFSTDVKEEVQIKGRTARKDNKGTYELVICREHLVKGKIITEDDYNVHSYGSLETIRKQLSDKKGKTVDERIRETERNHQTTMQYFGLV